MSDDPYAWIDPFEEIERQKWIAAGARAAGRDEVVSWLAGEEESAFRGSFRRHCDEMAEYIAYEMIRPHMQMHHSEYLEMKQRRRILADELYTVATPLIEYALSDGELKASLKYPTLDAKDERFQIRFYTKQPFNFAVDMCRSEEGAW